MIKGMNYKIYKSLMQIFINEENIFKMSKRSFLFNEYLNDSNLIIDKSIVNQLLDENLKLKSNKFYSKLKSLNLKIITINSKYYPNKFENMENKPLALLVYGNEKILINNMINMYTYCSNDFSSNGRNVYNVFMEFLSKENVNNIFNIEKLYMLSKINTIRKNNIYILNCNENTGSLDSKLYRISQCLEKIVISKMRVEQKNFCDFLIIFNNVLENKNNNVDLISIILDYMIIPEASLKEEIVSLVDCVCEYAKDILVVPSNIYQKTSYFSNYLIKQGADILLSTKDISFYTKKGNNSKKV